MTPIGTARINGPLRTSRIGWRPWPNATPGPGPSNWSS